MGISVNSQKRDHIVSFDANILFERDDIQIAETLRIDILQPGLARHLTPLAIRPKRQQRSVSQTLTMLFIHLLLRPLL